MTAARRELPLSTVRLLREVPDHTGVAMMLRHAERPPFTPGEHGGDLPITADGARLARDLGELVAGRLRSLRTSPVRRCVETAEALRAGAGASLEIEQTRLLGAPGAYVLDGHVAWQNWLDLGERGVIAHLCEQEDPLPGMAPPKDAARTLLEYMLSCVDGSPGIHVLVTHDALIAPTAARSLGARIEVPDFLEAAFFWADRGTRYAAYGEAARSIGSTDP